MRTHTLRLLDYWLGRLLCSVLTPLYGLKKSFVKKGPITAPKKILLIKLFGMGSIVLAMPAIRALKRKYPDTVLYFLTFAGNEQILTLSDMIPEKRIYTVRMDSYLTILADTMRCLFLLWRENIDVSVDMEFFSRFTAIFSFFTRSRHRIGFYGFHIEGLKRGNFMDFQINYNHTLHTSRLFMTLLRPFGMTEEDYDPELPGVAPTPHFRETINQLISRENASCRPGEIEQWLVINPNTSDLVTLRKWPADNFAAMASRLLQRHPSLGIIFIGSHGERAFTESLCNRFTESDETYRVVNLAGLTSLRTLLDVFHFGDLLVTNDSGPAHLASLTEIPSIVLFGPETPDLYAPLGGRARCIYLGLDCQPCITVYNGKRSHCRSNVCLQRITPASVVEMAEESLEPLATQAQEKPAGAGS
jgi:ADP-heptose:LPS heptosyltransferase